MTANEPSSEYPWPKPGDRPFLSKQEAKTTGPLSNAERLLGEMNEDVHDYALREGYYRAGQLIASQIQADRLIWPGVIFPMLYCFRHYLELSLKAVIPELARLARQPIDPELNLANEHRLMKLWNEYRRHHLKAYPTFLTDDRTDSVVERCINEMHQVDKSSQMFRYARDTGGQSFAGALPHVEIERLSTTMAGLRSYFEGADIYAGEMLERQRDIDLMDGK